jgi:hypothetical protein
VIRASPCNSSPIASPSSVPPSLSFPLAGVLPLRPPPHLPPMDSSRNYSSLLSPSVIPPGVDPSPVNFGKIYQGVPVGVKHRKKTTQAQLEILEQFYANDKKPNGIMRANLARQLEMTPRGVQVRPQILTTSGRLPISKVFIVVNPQVWFQNRYAPLHTPSSSISPHPTFVQEGEREDVG